MDNLDAMNEEELRGIVALNAYADPDSDDWLLCCYAESKADAIDARRCGRIDIALEKEQECDFTYDFLPDHMKW